MVYDKNGNITSLTRKNSGGNNRESLGYTYAGNRLSCISGTYNGSTDSGSFGYDANGNMLSDGVRGLTVTYFDELNLPKQYYQNSTNKVDYTYDAGGNNVAITGYDRNGNIMGLTGSGEIKSIANPVTKCLNRTFGFSIFFGKKKIESSRITLVYTEKSGCPG